MKARNPKRESSPMTPPLRNDSPLEGESAKQGRSPQVSRWGAVEGGGGESPHRLSRRLAARLLRLPLKGGVMGQWNGPFSRPGRVALKESPEFQMRVITH